MAGQAADTFAQGVQLVKRKTFLGRRKWLSFGRQRIVPGGSNRRSRARASIRIRLAALRSASVIIEPCNKAPRDAEGETRIMAVEPGLERAPGLAPLQKHVARAARPKGPAAPM